MYVKFKYDMIRSIKVSRDELTFCSVFIQLLEIICRASERVFVWFYSLDTIKVSTKIRLAVFVIKLYVCFFLRPVNWH